MLKELPKGVELVKTRVPVSLDVSIGNIRAAMARGLPECRKLPARRGRIALVGSAPSAAEHLAQIAACDAIWAINGAYDFLLRHGVVADFICLDRLPGMVEYVRNAQGSSTFYIASCCDPSVLDALADRNVILWHSAMADDPGDIFPPDTMTVTGGSTCLTRAPILANYMGWRDIHIFGGDSSFAEDKYCYQGGTYDGDAKAPVLWIEVDGKAFATEMPLAQQANQLCVIQDEIFKGSLKFHCGGLLDALLKSPIKTFEEAGIA